MKPYVVLSVDTDNLVVGGMKLWTNPKAAVRECLAGVARSRVKYPERWVGREGRVIYGARAREFLATYRKRRGGEAELSSHRESDSRTYAVVYSTFDPALLPSNTRLRKWPYRPICKVTEMPVAEES